MPNYLKQSLEKLRQTPQTQPIPGSNQVRNSAGGYTWAIDPWARLQRFLVLGSEKGSYYAREVALTAENTANVRYCARSDGLRTVREIVAMSQAGRAPKNDPALLALAVVAAVGDEPARRAALEALPLVARTGTHLFTFMDFVQSMRGWGRGLRRAVGGWYNGQRPRDLAYQMVKYRQRGGWTHRDALRLAHPEPIDTVYQALFRWVTQPESAEWARGLEAPDDDALAFVWAFERVQRATDVVEVVQLIEAYDLPREALPTHFLNEAAVWAALLARMPYTAMIRNLGVMARVGLLKSFSGAETTVLERLANAENLRRARVHPIALLSALRVYGQGHGVRSSGVWDVSARVVDALDDAFYAAFQYVEPAGKRMMLALDVSGSMGVGEIAGVPGLTPRDASAAMALVTAHTEPQYMFMGFAQNFVSLNISAGMRLDTAIQNINGLPFGGTDCAQPMIYATENRLEIDTFVVYTDNETWAGAEHPAQALVRYREAMGIPARLVVVGLLANPFSMADPNDAGMLDVIGFDSSAPALISAFARDDL